MSPVEQSKSLVTAYLLGDEEATAMLIAESGDPQTVEALAALAGTFIRQVASHSGLEADELWRRTLCSYAALQARP